MTLTLVDHALAAVLVILMPVYGRWSWTRLEGALRSGRDGARRSAYASTMLVEWALASVLLVAWMALGRPLQSIGLTGSLEPAFVVTLLVALISGTLLVLQVRGVTRLDHAALESVERRLASVRLLLPHSAGERHIFVALSITAGFCEELLYRGFLIGYLAGFTTLPAAVLVSSLVFGLLHAYQGGAGIVKTAGVGFVMAVVTVLAGSIWPAVLLHAAVDVQGGLIGYHVLSRRTEALAD